VEIFEEYVHWGNIMGIKDIGSLNRKIQSGQVKDLILTGEAFTAEGMQTLPTVSMPKKKPSNWSFWQAPRAAEKPPRPKEFPHS
jgi:hypothetical protein